MSSDPGVLTLDVLERSLRFLDLTGITDPGQVETRRLYLQIANGSVPPGPVLAGLETVAGGELAVGTLPIRTAPRTLVHRFDWQWWNSCAALERFVAEHGRVPSKVSADPEEKRLGFWVQTQRSSIAGRGTPLIADQVARLVLIPGFATDRAAKWDEDCAAVERFVAERGRVPKARSADPEEKRLGCWVNNQRSSIAGNRASLTSDQVARIMRIPGFATDRAAKWDENCSAVERFVAERGRVPREGSGDPEEKRLGVWVGTQKRSISGKRAPLTTEQVARLVLIPGFVIDRAPTWDENCAAVEKFVAEHRRTPKPHSTVKDERRLGNWVGSQKNSIAGRGVALTADRVARLALIPGFVTDRAPTWDESCAALERFVAEHGRTPKHRSVDPEEKRLGVWVQTQRNSIAGRRAPLTADRVARLVLIPGFVTPELQAHLDGKQG